MHILFSLHLGEICRNLASPVSPACADYSSCCVNYMFVHHSCASLSLTDSEQEWQLLYARQVSGTDHFVWICSGVSVVHSEIKAKYWTYNCQDNQKQDNKNGLIAACYKAIYDPPNLLVWPSQSNQVANITRLTERSTSSHHSRDELIKCLTKFNRLIFSG